VVVLANKQWFPPVAPRHRMIHRSRILESQLPCHARYFALFLAVSSRKYRNTRTDPFDATMYAPYAPAWLVAVY